MASEITTSTPNWTALQGKILDGGYEISECLLSSSESASFRIRVLGDRSLHPVVNVFRPEAAPLEQYLLWQEAMELKHPNLSTPISVGRLDWESASYPYVVLHKADENLAGVIRQRALTAAEAREVLRNVGAGLEYLHANGLVHSALAPEHVLALGDAIRISSTSLRRINTPLQEAEPDAAYRAPESETENVTVAADIWCLGATLFEVLTKKKCEEGCREQAKTLPDPFDWIVERCLDPEPYERPTLSEIFAMLSGGLTRPAPEPPPAAPPAQEEEAAAAPAAMMTVAAGAAAAASAAQPQAEAAPAAPQAPAAMDRAPVASASSAAASAAEPARSGSASPVMRPGNAPPPRSARNRPTAGPATPPPMRPSEPLRPKLTASPKPVYTENGPRALRKEERGDESPRVKFLSYAFLAIVLAGGLLWIARPKPDKSQLQSGNRTAPNAAPLATPAARTQTVAPEPASPAGTPPLPGAVAARAAAARNARPAAAAEPGASWRVVVFTFAHQEDASRQAQALNSKHPGFDPQVFSPDGKAPYVIVLGGPMTRDEANRVRQKARSSGFPRDTYIQNFNR
jgi:serine/threonine protein kinase